MRAASLTDSLTDLPNSRALVAHLDQRLRRAPTEPVPSALIMIDLDDFKAINDVHGHQVGDLCAADAGQPLRRQVRASDFCARYGGDEFVVVLAVPGPRRGRASRRGPAARRGASARTAPDGAALALSISVGVAMSGEDGHDLRSAARSGRPPDVCGQVPAQSWPAPRATAIRLARSASNQPAPVSPRSPPRGDAPSLTPSARMQLLGGPQRRDCREA